MLVLAALALAGCARQELFPLEVGRVLTLHVRTGLGVAGVEQMAVTRKLSVADTTGYELTGARGTSRLAWKGDTLVAEAFPNVRFEPALPILVAGDPQAVRHWRGSVVHLGVAADGVATLTQAEVDDRLGSRKLKAVETRLVIKAAGHTMEITSAYTPQVGLLRQRQTTDGRFDVALEFLDGSADMRK